MIILRMCDILKINNIEQRTNGILYNQMTKMIKILVFYVLIQIEMISIFFLRYNLYVKHSLVVL